MKSIRARLTLSLGVLFFFSWCFGGLAVYLTLRSEMTAEFDRALRASTEALAGLSEQSQGAFDFDPAPEVMSRFERRDRPEYFQIWAANGTTLVRSPSLRQADLPRLAGTLSAPHLWNLILPDGLRGRAIGLRFPPKQDEDTPPAGLVHEVTLVMASHREELGNRLGLIKSVLLLAGAGTAVATVLVVTLVVRRGLWPLSQLAERATTIDASSLGERFASKKMPDEVSQISRRLNDLMARLEGSFTREKRFSGDVAHELRTPIAELRTLAEVALRWPDDVAATRKVLQDALEIALQMESLVAGLLTLARCEAGLLAVHPEAIPIEELIREILHSLAREIEAKRLAVTLHVPESTCWLTDRVALRSMVTNLLANAVQHSPSGSAIQLHIESGVPAGRLRISNATKELAQEDLPQLFERFWRKDGARSSNANCGLGLALTRAYAQALGMTFRAELTDDSEITFELSGAQTCEAREAHQTFLAPNE